MYLFEGLCLLQKEMGLSFAVAHVDHGWREESAKEAEFLRELCSQRRLAFYEKKLDPNQLSGNLEAACRSERLKFFKELSNQYGFQGVFLGHHKDDAVETTLKKVFEGARLDTLGLKAFSQVEGVSLLRPILSLSKQEIMRYLEEKRIPFFYDVTNTDQRFMRARMRENLLPYLKKHFGKDITEPLRRLGEQAEELSTFLDEMLAPFMAKVDANSFGLCLDLSNRMPESEFLLKQLVRRFCVLGGFSLSHAALDQSVLLLKKGASNRQFEAGESLLAIDRKKMMLLLKKRATLPLPLKLKPGLQNFGAWHIHVERGGDIPSFASTGWEQVFKNGFVFTLPEGEYEVGSADLSASFLKGKSLDKWWTEHKVPAVLRARIPVIWQGNTIVWECLTKCSNVCLKEEKDSLKVTICYR